MNEIKTISDIQQLLSSGFADWATLGNVVIKEKGGLNLFNYTPKAQFERRWNFFERVSRGLILDSNTGEIVARPFDKFFNWGEGDRFTNASIVNITEKMDGSLGILYRVNGAYHIATRGSFNSDQAQWATEFLNTNFYLGGLPNSLTLLFEIIYPDNRVVVDYQDKQDIVLLAARNRGTGVFLPWSDVKELGEHFNFSLPGVYRFSTIDYIVEARNKIDANSEGWVVEFSDGQRFKFKGIEYLKIHKLISHLSFKNTLACIASNTLSDLFDVVPDEFLGEVKSWVSEIYDTVHSIEIQAQAAFELAPKNARKDFALWVMEYHKNISVYMFALLDKKPLKPLIYKHAFKDKEIYSQLK